MNRNSKAIICCRASSRARGFTLLELVISLAILTVVSGAVFEQINQMQKKSSSEAMKVDLSQEAREFVDQTVHDLHMSGYPGASMFSNPQDQTKVAAGLLSVSPTQVLFEADVDNDGNVDNVNVEYVASDPNDSNCPCIRRSIMPKQALVDSLHPPLAAAYTETQHVFPPGTGAGQSGEDLFAYYDQNGIPVDLTSGSDTSTQKGKDNLARIKTIKINVTLLTTLPNGMVRNSMSATARLNQ